MLRKHNFQVALTTAKKNKSAYLFVLPYALIFFMFTILPIIVSIVLSFTYYNVLEPPRFTGIENYFNLFLQDQIFITGVKNTLIFAVITGPAGYILAFLMAWLINELPRGIRTVAVVVFYSPSLAGNIFTIFQIIFRGDAYGFVNSWLMELGLIDAPILFFVNPKYMMPICIAVSLWMSLGVGFLSFVAGLQGVDPALHEAGYVDGVKNRWQELWFITLPSMKPMLLFGAVMSIASSFNAADVTMGLCGMPSTDYAVRTIVSHLIDYGSLRYEMGYASAIATILFLMMMITKKAVSAFLNRLGT